MIENSRTHSLEDYLSALASMTKFKITIAVCTTTLVGFVLARKGLDSTISIPALALFLVASGSAALNHFQEHHLDSRMGRTKGRMISSGMMNSWTVLGLASVLILIGVGALYLSAGINPALLGILAIIWYNGIYTPLKRVSPFAVIPGGVIGMLPPLIGWNIGGGYLADPTILAFCFFIFMWQVPHFWLLALHYRKEYEEAGFPTVTQKFTEASLCRIVYSWILATGTSALLIPVYGGINYVLSGIIIAILGIWISLIQIKLCRVELKPINYKKSFMELNSYALAVMIITFLDQLMSFS